MTDRLADLTTRLLQAATRAGADNADAIAIDGRSQSIDVLSGKLEHAERSEGTDIGLRVLIGQQQACVSSSDIRTETIATMAERAVAMAREAPADPSLGLAEPSQLVENADAFLLQLIDPSAEPSPQELENDALAAEAAALGVAGVAQVQGSSAGYSHRTIHLAATNGFSAGYGRTSRFTSCVAISGEGAAMERDYCVESRTFQADLPPAAAIGKLAGERAVERANPSRPPTGAYPVLFDERIAASLIGHLVAAINGTSIVRGSSWLLDGLGTQILPTSLSLTEDPTRVRISGSRPFDAEGLAPRPRKIVQNGILTGWTLDLGSARQLNMQSTASASRGTSAPPSPTTGNLQLTQGKQSRDDLIRDMGTGLIITSMIGATISPTTGDYSRGASGFWVENGEITGPVNECTVAGNLRDMLNSLVPADDAKEHLSRVVPSLLVEGLTIAGD